MKVKEVTVKESFDFNTVSLTADVQPNEDVREGVLSLRAEARRLVRTQLVMRRGGDEP